MVSRSHVHHTPLLELYQNPHEIHLRSDSERIATYIFSSASLSLSKKPMHSGQTVVSVRACSSEFSLRGTELRAAHVLTGSTSLYSSYIDTLTTRGRMGRGGRCAASNLVFSSSRLLTMGLSSLSPHTEMMQPCLKLLLTQFVVFRRR